MSLDQLRAFVTIASVGSVSAAARALHISQPPLSRQLSALEDELATPLFDRAPRGMTLTRAGSRLLPRAKAVLEAVDDILRDAAVVGDDVDLGAKGGVVDADAQGLDTQPFKKK
jgi:DNA-binding transcriptional LysR family regulator